jgi:hypothetical protein
MTTAGVKGSTFLLTSFIVDPDCYIHAAFRKRPEFAPPSKPLAHKEGGDEAGKSERTWEERCATG